MKKPTTQDRKHIASFMAYIGIAPLQFDSRDRGKQKRKRAQIRHQRAKS